MYPYSSYLAECHLRLSVLEENCGKRKSAYLLFVCFRIPRIWKMRSQFEENFGKCHLRSCNRDYFLASTAGKALCSICFRGKSFMENVLCIVWCWLQHKMKSTENSSYGPPKTSLIEWKAFLLLNSGFFYYKKLSKDQYK